MHTEKDRIEGASKLIPILVFTAVIIVVGLYGFFFLRQHDNIVQGEAEITEIRISSKIPGRIAKFYFDEGDYVQKGDTLAILSAPDIDAKLLQARAAEEGAMAQNRKAIKGARGEEKQAAYEMWQKARAGLEIAQKSYTRMQNLFDKGVVTAQKRDEAEANYKASAATERAARAQYDMALNGAEAEDKDAAESVVERARGAVAEVKSYVDESYIISAVDGQITERYPNESELIGTGSPIFNIMDFSDKWGSFNVREDRLKNFKMGDVLSVYVPALDREVDMKVYYHKDLGSYAAWKATKTTGDYDRKTFEVRARFVDSDGQRDVIPGMSLIIKE
ncbi:HlyD family secretion protein [Dysgonomonas sp. 25]|uniref:HlyD family secretion protein n=1 Tax=Dysgonomonas sp. 25 TaxID=2302933 RepID=UPI0013CF5E1D|nr:biotin/lipoyl-binding protein [Dysgonomonas sp. 25]NDV69398.1 biotin/lipoyl-binding protein [Dysgonomonas sp. 25]